jgi:hypothetical protein
VERLPLYEAGFVNCPAIPYWANAYGDPHTTWLTETLTHLGERGLTATPAYLGLATPYTIAGQTHMAYRFLYDLEFLDKDWQEASPPANLLPLGDGSQFNLPWTTFGGMRGDSNGLEAVFASWLEDKDEATKNFWPTIANYGLPYNLLVLEKVSGDNAQELAAEFGDAWAAEGMDELVAAGRAYAIDMRIMASLPPFRRTVIGLMPPFHKGEETRFTPGTLTILDQDPVTKELTPRLITLSTEGGPKHSYKKADPAWLYALQAAKTSITVWGIWLGHVYHLHIVTAAMQMAMFDKLGREHPVRELLEPQSQSLIGFDYVLLTALWEQISPPTPLAGGMQLLTLLDTYAQGRKFLDDDPLNELARRGIKQEDFTKDPNKPWDAYPVAGYAVDLYKTTRNFVSAVVHDIYKTEQAMKDDGELKAWLEACSNPREGNIRLDPVTTVEDLVNVLASVLYRVTVHGAGSLTPSVHPALSFVANFPPCLTSTQIPKPGDAVSPQELRDRLPHTGTIGGMATFYYTFAYTPADQPLIPSGGITEDPYFPGPPTNARNQALFAYRGAIHSFVDEYVANWNQAITRLLPGRGPDIPDYAKNQYPQWARSIEI